MLQRCSNCGENHEVCPECKSTFFTWKDNPSGPNLRRFILDKDVGASMVINSVCWDCGYTSEKVILIDDERN